LAPVRAVVDPTLVMLVVVVVDAVVVVVLGLGLGLGEAPLATPASVKLITNARNAPASRRRAMDPVVRTLFSPIRVCC